MATGATAILAGGGGREGGGRGSEGEKLIPDGILSGRRRGEGRGGRRVVASSSVSARQAAKGENRGILPVIHAVALLFFFNTDIRTHHTR